VPWAGIFSDPAGVTSFKDLFIRSWFKGEVRGKGLLRTKFVPDSLVFLPSVQIR
jgi:hypothetical protein